MGGGGCSRCGFDDLCLIMTIALSGQCDNKESSSTAGGCSFEGLVAKFVDSCWAVMMSSEETKFPSNFRAGEG